MSNKKAFSIVEIISTVSILIIIAVIWFSYQGAKMQNTKSAGIISELEEMNNEIISFKSENNSLPDIIGNKNYFDKMGNYSENKEDSFGVHGFINNKFAYGKTSDENFYQIAGVLNIDGKYVSKVVGNYVGNKKLIGLIREYNGPSFIYDGSEISFPYNPTENRIVAKINNFSGKVIIKTKNGEEIKYEKEILKYNLIEGDSIETDFSSKVTIFFSDGSISVLEENSKITLKNMDKKNNLITKVKLFLESGILWTKATSLNSEGSEFEVYTEDNTAAIRGTIFGIKYRGNKTSLTVKKGEVKLKSNKTNEEKTIKSGEYEGDKIKFTEFKIVRPDIIYDKISNTVIINKIKTKK